MKIDHRGITTFEYIVGEQKRVRDREKERRKQEKEQRRERKRLQLEEEQKKEEEEKKEAEEKENHHMNGDLRGRDSKESSGSIHMIGVEEDSLNTIDEDISRTPSREGIEIPFESNGHDNALAIRKSNPEAML